MVLAGYQRHLGENVKTDCERCFEDLDDWKAQLSTFRVVTLEQSGRKLPAAICLTQIPLHSAYENGITPLCISESRLVLSDPVRDH